MPYVQLDLPDRDAAETKRRLARRMGDAYCALMRARPGIVSVEVSGRRLDRLGARAGQYLHWRFLARGRWLRARTPARGRRDHRCA